MWASGDIIGSSCARMASQSYPKLDWDGQAFLHPGIDESLGMGHPRKK